VRRLVRLTDWDLSRDRIVYAGDDESDAVAIRWVLSKGGAGFVVGNRISVPRTRHVENPTGLARAIREFAENFPSRDQENARRYLHDPFEVKDCALSPYERTPPRSI